MLFPFPDIQTNRLLQKCIKFQSTKSLRIMPMHDEIKSLVISVFRYQLSSIASQNYAEQAGFSFVYIDSFQWGSMEPYEMENRHFFSQISHNNQMPLPNNEGISIPAVLDFAILFIFQQFLSTNRIQYFPVRY